MDIYKKWEVRTKVQSIEGKLFKSGEKKRIIWSCYMRNNLDQSIKQTSAFGRKS
jgi:hypothetical protein